MTEEYVPTPTEIWDFLVGLKETTESGFLRVESSIHHAQDHLHRVEGKLDRVDERLDRVDGRLDRMDERLDRVDGRLDRMEGRLIRIDDRLSGLEDVSIRPRLDDHEQRIMRLERPQT